MPALDYKQILQEAAGRTPAAIRGSLPIAYVLDVEKVEYDIGEDGKIHTVCPFHQDSHPSFDVWGERWESWGCFPCGLMGDVLDLLQKLHNESFSDALARAVVLAAQCRTTGWTGPQGVSRPPSLDLVEASRIVESSLHDLAGLDQFLQGRKAPFSAAALSQAWRVGSIAGRVIMPYYTADGRLVTYKYRFQEGKPFSARGGKHTVLYGAWRRDHAYCPILLCEGETDCWMASYQLLKSPLDWTVLGLPAGAGTHPAPFMELLQEREVYIAFDGDSAGKEAATRWASAIGEKSVILPIPAGQDLWDLGDGLLALFSEV